MEESSLILAELQRIRVLLSRFVVFVAVFSLLIVLPALALVSLASWAVVRPMDPADKAAFQQMEREADAAIESMRRALR